MTAKNINNNRSTGGRQISQAELSKHEGKSENKTGQIRKKTGHESENKVTNSGRNASFLCAFCIGAEFRNLTNLTEPTLL